MIDKISGDFINKITDLSLPDIYYGNKLGLIEDSYDNSETDLITFIDDRKYIRKVLRNEKIISIYTTHELWDELKNSTIQPIFCEDPRFYFYSLYNFIGHLNYVKRPSRIATTSKINSKAFVSEYNVVIGSNTVIEPNATILPDVEIGDNVIIRAGAVIGSEGFEHKKTSKGILSVFHSGKVIIYDNVEIGANSCVDKGLIRNTVIHPEVKIDNLVHIAHSVVIGKKSFITAGVLIAGSVKIGENVWLSVGDVILNNVHIGNNSFVGANSLVLRTIKENSRVFGIPAISLLHE